ncbi:ATP-binding cassette domain-containing protein [Jonesia quinghaiensis]|uniref:ATP-binding cassette domain-containing protein n=1 Tax=Jonesia quinghaiensis TaxID=262806 RepID=UPI0004277D80|nr:ATP-binding cassette domain-containing protein [Jonesia quinghaiensis]
MSNYLAIPTHSAPLGRDIHLRDIVHVENGDVVLDIEEATITPGVTAIVGPHHTHASALLRVLSTLEEPTMGTVTVGGVPFGGRSTATSHLTSGTPALGGALTGGQTSSEPGGSAALARLRSRIGYVPTDVSIDHTTSIASLVTNAAWLRGLNGHDAREAARTTLDTMGLTSVHNKRVRSIARIRKSRIRDNPARRHGANADRRARTALAMACVAQPAFVFLDQPTRWLLNPSEQDNYLQLIRHTGAGTVLISTNNIHEAAQFADHIMVLNEGRILAHDTVQGFVDSAPVGYEEDTPLDAAYQAALASAY